MNEAFVVVQHGDEALERSVIRSEQFLSYHLGAYLDRVHWAPIHTARLIQACKENLTLVSEFLLAIPPGELVEVGLRQAQLVLRDSMSIVGRIVLAINVSQLASWLLL